MKVSLGYTVAGLLLTAALFSQQESARRLTPVAPARRLALVIGNQTYTRKPLRNPRADATAVAGLLRSDLAFTEVHQIEDANLITLQREIRAFVRKVRPGDLALFYYSGHGMQLAGVNWMIPVDFRADFEDEVPDQAYPVQRVLKDLQDAGASVRILILDACRDNPLPAAASRSGRDGLVSMNGAEGTYLMFATGENSTADDNPRGTNGIFTSHLVAALRRPGVTLDQAFKETRREVAVATNGKQRPWLMTDIDHDVVLRPGATDDAPQRIARNESNPAGFDPEIRRRFQIALEKLKLPIQTPGARKTNPKDGLSYVWIPPGKFMMGCSPGDSECENDEKPPHPVMITRGFWLAQTPVTVGAWKKYRTATGKPALPAEDMSGRRLNEAAGDDSIPSVFVTWDEAAGYCAWIAGRLPTEAELEYAARAENTQARYGDLDSIAWYADNSGRKRIDSEGISRTDVKDYSKGLYDNGNSPKPVGRKQPNAWSLYDMLGNVWQWTSDWYSHDHYEKTEATDPKGPTDSERRAMRGGSWGSTPKNVRASNRSGYQPDNRNPTIGFRCVGE